jgi:hypothetical protein
MAIFYELLRKNILNKRTNKQKDLRVKKLPDLPVWKKKDLRVKNHIHNMVTRPGSCTR